MFSYNVESMVILDMGYFRGEIGLNGGDFYFPDSKQKVKLKHNRAIFFPSMLEHGVSPVKMKTEPKEVGYGRYTITHFYISMPPGNIRV